MLSLPSYVRNADLGSAAIRYRWDDGDLEQVGGPDEELLPRLETLSQRANIAFACGSAEWIVGRLASQSDLSRALRYLEASYAQVVDFRYGSFFWAEDADRDEWAGPTRHPVYTALGDVSWAVYRARHDQSPAVAAACLSTLTQYLLSDPSSYLDWSKRVLQRLEALYRLDPEETLGDVVPREALDPGYDFRVEETETLVNQFLARLHPAENEFLTPPADVLEEGFDGTPYRFDLEHDRRNRYEW